MPTPPRAPKPPSPHAPAPFTQCPELPRAPVHPGLGPAWPAVTLKSRSVYRCLVHEVGAPRGNLRGVGTEGGRGRQGQGSSEHGWSRLGGRASGEGTPRGRHTRGKARGGEGSLTGRLTYRKAHLRECTPTGMHTYGKALLVEGSPRWTPVSGAGLPHCHTSRHSGGGGLQDKYPSSASAPVSVLTAPLPHLGCPPTSSSRAACLS